VTYLAADRLGLLPDPSQDPIDLLAAVVNYSGNASKPMEAQRPREPREQTQEEQQRILRKQ